MKPPPEPEQESPDGLVQASACPSGSTELTEAVNEIEDPDHPNRKQEE